MNVRRRGRPLTIVLATALAVSLVSGVIAWRLPGNNRGYAPVQPIAFSHRLHAGDLQISCFYCHSSAETSRYAGIPATNVCQNCHRAVRATTAQTKGEEELAARESREPRPIVSPELKKLYSALALNDELDPIPGRAPMPVAWTKVHVLPDFVYFDHRAHVAAGLVCQRCHGPIATMERVRQVETLTMGWCVDCHREMSNANVNGKAVHASLDCGTCHY